MMKSLISTSAKKIQSSGPMKHVRFSGLLKTFYFLSFTAISWCLCVNGTAVSIRSRASIKTTRLLTGCLDFSCCFFFFCFFFLLFARPVAPSCGLKLSCKKNKRKTDWSTKDKVRILCGNSIRFVHAAVGCRSWGDVACFAFEPVNFGPEVGSWNVKSHAAPPWEIHMLQQLKGQYYATLQNWEVTAFCSTLCSFQNNEFLVGLGWLEQYIPTQIQ